MVSRAEALLELERRGELAPQQQNAVNELRRRGEIGPALTAESGGTDQPETWGEYGAGIARSLGQGVSLGLGDEVEAAVRAPFSDRSYGDIVKDVRGQNERFAGKHRALDFALQAGAGLAVPGLGAAKFVGMGGNTLAKLARTGVVGAGWGGATGFGTGEGGVENRLISGGIGAGTGFVAAPVMGGLVAPAAKYIAGKAVEGGKVARDTFGDFVPGWRRGGLQRVGRALERSGTTPEKAIAHLDETRDLSRYGQTQVEVPEVIADIGTGTRRLSRAIQAMPGRGNDKATKFLETRQRGDGPELDKADRTPGSFERFTNYLGRALKVSGKRADAEEDKLIARQKADSDPAYQKFRDAKGADGLPLKIDVGDILARSEEADADLAPELTKVMKRAREQFMHRDILRDESPALNNEVRLGKGAIAGEAPTTRLAPARFESGYRALEDMITAAEGRGLNNQVRLLTGLKNELRDAAIAATSSTKPGKMKPVDVRTLPKGQLTPVFDSGGNITHYIDNAGKTIPAYTRGPGATTSLFGQALDAYSGPAALKDALAKGRAFGSPDNTGATITVADYKAMTSAEKRFFRVGLFDRLRRTLGGKTRGSDMGKMFDTPNMQEMMEAIAGRKETQRLYKLFGREANMLQSRNANRGSQTQGIGQDIQDFGFGERLSENVAKRGVAATVIDAASTFVANRLRMREKDAELVSRYIYETDPVKQRDILRRVAKAYSPGLARRMARQVDLKLGPRLPQATGQESGRQDRQPTEVTISRPAHWPPLREEAK